MIIIKSSNASCRLSAIIQIVPFRPSLYISSPKPLCRHQTLPDSHTQSLNLYYPYFSWLSKHLTCAKPLWPSMDYRPTRDLRRLYPKWKPRSRIIEAFASDLGADSPPRFGIHGRRVASGLEHLILPKRRPVLTIKLLGTFAVLELRRTSAMVLLLVRRFRCRSRLHIMGR